MIVQALRTVYAATFNSWYAKQSKKNYEINHPKLYCEPVPFRSWAER